MTIENMFRLIHSWNRWLLVGVTLVALIYLGRGWFTAQPWTKYSQMLLKIFSSLVGMQWVLGAVLLANLGSITGLVVPHYWEHLTIQTIALGVSYLHVMWRKKELDDKTRYKRSFLMIISVLILTVGGIMALPANIQWRLMAL